ncbi:RNA polymerase sigma factor [Nocardioides sp. GCM10027113]|uniref:RNA polymerase sigma factor n=1 Tax=unclassified Nocardioides TaxID=2615069 RepID=UPI003608967E
MSAPRGPREAGEPGLGPVGRDGVDEQAQQAEQLRAHSFREFVEPEIEVMLRVAHSLTASAADAEDLVQEALLRAYRGLHRFDGRHPRAWLLTILRNTNANLHRRQRPVVVEDAEVLRSSRPAFGGAELPSAEQAFLDEELDEELHTAVHALDPRFREALVLVDVHDLSYAEAAAVMGVPVGTVMSRLSRARERVRKALGPHYLSRGGLS